MITVINFGSTKTPHILSMVKALGHDCEEVKWNDFTSEKYGQQRSIIFSGSPTFLTEVDHAPYHERFSCVKLGRVPVLGICFGHQVMGILHGAQIYRGPEVRTTIPVHIVKQDALFRNLEAVTAMAEDHTEGISLPPSFIHLAYSEKYPIEAMRHTNLPLWGVQFHPEVSDENGKTLIGNFLQQC
ncbi:MAG: gamma-glutamyl-gamma-aminobutyrate hydrolase family protein [Bacteroidia bacterium]|nr:gamma-glutamyl-gamma-aminobutyrate hydrolase family protein [Bacteroidia bacterium]